MMCEGKQEGRATEQDVLPRLHRQVLYALIYFMVSSWIHTPHPPPAAHPQYGALYLKFSKKKKMHRRDHVTLVYNAGLKMSGKFRKGVS